jgi:hypothetical protein
LSRSLISALIDVEFDGFELKLLHRARLSRSNWQSGRVDRFELINMVIRFVVDDIYGVGMKLLLLLLMLLVCFKAIVRVVYFFQYVC